MIIVIMGLFGSDKVKVGKLLSDHLRWQFYDAAEFYPPAAREKLAQGAALTDAERGAWYLTLRSLLIQNVHSNRSVVLACSALKETYRQSLRVNAGVYFVYLRGTQPEIEARLARQPDRPAGLPRPPGEFEELEEPREALEIDFKLEPSAIVERIRSELKI